MSIMKCQWCGRNHTEHSKAGYCSEKCLIAARASQRSSSGGSSSISSGPLVGIIFVIGFIVAGVNLIQNAFPSVKIDIVSASCETEENFVSIVEEALSKVPEFTRISGDNKEFTTYSVQARDAVKKRHEDRTLKDNVYFVRLPDKVNVYIWFRTENNTTAFVYKTK